MKKIVILIILFIFSLCIFGCGDVQETKAEQNDNRIEKYTEGFAERFNEYATKQFNIIIRVVDTDGNVFNEHNIYAQRGTQITYNAPDLDGYEFLSWRCYIGEYDYEKETSFNVNKDSVYEAVYLKEKVRTTMYSSTTLNIRTSPEVADNNKVSKVAVNTELVILDYDENAEWNMIEYEGARYYVSTPYLRSEKTIIKNVNSIVCSYAVDFSYTTVWSKDGVVLNQEIASYLYNKLKEYNIEWFMPFAVCIAYQESRFNPNALNTRNMLDKGLLQYREGQYVNGVWKQYWDYSWGDIWDYHAQINCFALQMSNRAKAGFSVEEMISKHNMSDWGPYNQDYVNQVLQHLNKTR